MPRYLFLWTGSISYEGFSFRQVACLYLFPVILCLISVVDEGAGFLASGGQGRPVLRF